MNHSKDGYHFNSTYWQQKKLLLPPLSPELLEIAFGRVLGDATIRKVSRHAVIKFEQGYRQKEFVESLFQTFHTYTFMEQPGIRLELSKAFGFVPFPFHVLQSSLNHSIPFSLESIGKEFMRKLCTTSSIRVLGTM